jgi:hypothetical protein
VHWRLLSTCLLVGAIATPTAARANGRFPASNAVVRAPRDPSFLALRVTFGLLVSRDAGASFGFVCERAIGFSGTEDPAYVVTPSGAIVVGLFDGVRVSRDGGCTWERAESGSVKGFVDLTTREDGAVIALASSYARAGDAGSLFTTLVLESRDDARTFAPLGPALDPTLLAETVDVTPRDDARVYVSAVRGEREPRRGVLAVSTSRGARWVERDIPLVDKELGPFIAAVDPASAEGLYVRTSAAPEHPTRVLATDDAGKKWRVVWTNPGATLGFALAGAELFVGGFESRVVRGPATGPGAFDKRSDVRVQCLHHDGRSLWACSNEASGFILGRSEDRGATFAPVLHLRDIRGPLACPAGSGVARECGVEWARLRRELGLDDPSPVASAVGDAGATPEAAAASPRGVDRRLPVAVGLAVAAVVAGVLFRRRRR